MKGHSLKLAMLMSALAVAHSAGAAMPRVMQETPPKTRKRVAVDRSKLNAQQREIAEWNDRVEQRKAEKKGQRS